MGIHISRAKSVCLPRAADSSTRDEQTKAGRSLRCLNEYVEALDQFLRISQILFSNPRGLSADPILAARTNPPLAHDPFDLPVLVEECSPMRYCGLANRLRGHVGPPSAVPPSSSGHRRFLIAKAPVRLFLSDVFIVRVSGLCRSHRGAEHPNW